MKLDTGKAFAFAWRNAYRVPEPLLRGVFRLVADVTWARHGSGVRRLEKNLGRVRPELDERALRALSRAAMRSYMRYYKEAFKLPALTADQIAARVRTVGADAVRARIAEGRTPVLALGHQGNWDLAGAWATPNLAPVLTVAERLEPPELYEEFLRFRNSIGIEILALGDQDVFRTLVRAVQGPGKLVPLLADRDLGASGVEVDLFGHRARVAAGPAALAVAGAPLFATNIYYERLRGARRAAAGSPWGIVLDFSPEVAVDRDLPRGEQVSATTQAWVTAYERALRTHPEDWHMLQRVFVDDLDPDRDAAVRSGRAPEQSQQTHPVPGSGGPE
ncbi:lipid A biosynthesis lauroyl acyltransferase [Paraoerskovia sediminicola]|uniref:Lipid A biosynthesis lauroyl acyltransferase n=1 Tax=Paraoerskovia sediminicola TaxID=1138587 RepID=A0ABM8G5N0_9CELL|nr:phosphatidylinositol mannoside acyltransferase [Paraoerskovia sediminicola]BDZ43464.1 lipid A biosynthesis lauroyl acyltransferase [Paraoerskovia sediminicola]